MTALYDAISRQDWPAALARLATHAGEAAIAGRYGWLPLHAAAAYRAPLEMMQALLQALVRELDCSVLRHSAPPPLLALLVGPDGHVRRYTKLHPFSFAGEHEHYAAGEQVESWVVDGVRITPFICYDLRFPEVFRQTVDRTDLYVVIANWPERRRAHWQALLLARAIEDQAYVAGVNRVGDGGGLHYSGDSALISPWGERLVAAAEAEAVLVGTVDPAVVAAARAQFPVLRDRRGGA